MSTVGFGDYTPWTNFGKVFCIFSCWMGIFLLSMLVAVWSLHVFFNSDELKVYRKWIEKEIVYTEMPLEIREVFNILSDMFLLRRMPKNGPKTIDEVDNKKETWTLNKLLLKFKWKKLNEKKRQVIKADDNFTESFWEKYEAHWDWDFTECSQKTVSIIKNQQRWYEIANNHSRIIKKVFDSKDYANRIANWANWFRVIKTCGKIKNIFDIEGGRLFTRKELVDYQRYFYYDAVMNMKKMEGVNKRGKCNDKWEY